MYIGSMNTAISTAYDETIVAFGSIDSRYQQAEDRASAIAVLVITAEHGQGTDVSITTDEVRGITKALRERRESPVAKAMARATLKAWLKTDPDDDDTFVLQLKEIIE